MPLDANSICPGGTGKKIKFCCGDFLPELQKLSRMLEGEQFQSCLQQIDRLLADKANSDRACLLALKCQALTMTRQFDALATAAADFLAKHPDNQNALAESAIVAAPGDVRAAMDLLQRAIRAANGKLGGRTYQAIGFMAAILFERGFPLPARALLLLQCGLVHNDERAESMLGAISQTAEVPLLLREEARMANCPQNAPWKKRFAEAMEPIGGADWQTAADRLAALAADVSDAPSIWKNLAILYGRLARNADAANAWRKYAALRAAEPNGLEEAVEAEATAMFLADDALGDAVDMLKVVWTVKDPEKAHEAFLSSSRFRPVGIDPTHFGDGETPPPKGAYMLLDRPALDSAETALTLDNVPRLLGHALLFGRQTDREARLEMVGLPADELPSISAMIREAAGDAVDPEPKQEVFGRQSATVRMLRASWLPPRGVSPDKMRDVTVGHARDVILNRWPNLKLGVLGGRSPREAAGAGQGAALADQIRVLAAITVLEHWAQQLPGDTNFNKLRAQLGLPTLAPIDPSQQPLADLPLVRLSRLTVERLSDKDLIAAFFRAGGFALRPALRKFAQAIIDRPSLADTDERQQAYATMARTEEDPARAMEHIAEGRRQVDARGQSNAAWDLMELSLAFAHHDGPNAVRLLEHIQSRHAQEPGVGETLTQIMIDVGLLNPDGTPVAMPDLGPAAEEPAAPAPGGLWTPDSAEPASGGGKLWTPE
ncbi:MAG: hypothetical protein LLG00_13560 [Planctomycetaceae bacterium]|nr:hypothetical protein [Planctomycetaceae bacterium]